MQAEVRSALRALVRAQRITFRGDAKARIAARELNRALLAPALDPNTSEEDKRNALTGALQAAQYFRQNVLQGVANEPDTFGRHGFHAFVRIVRDAHVTLLRPIPTLSNPSLLNADPLQSMPLKALRIHSETALGDNESIKNAAPAPSLKDIKASMNAGSVSSSNPQEGTPRRRRRKMTSGTSPEAQEGQGTASTNYNDAAPGMGSSR